MQLRREITLGLGAILGLQIALCALAIGLFMRQGPAIEQILQENVYCIVAVTQMLASLNDTRDPEARADFEHALDRASANVTEEAEQPLIDTITREHQRALSGNEDARVVVVTSLRDLDRINRASMERADNRAKRLGQAGAWATAILGALSLILGILAYRRLRERLELPIEELRRVAHQVRHGNLQARASTDLAPAEITQIASDFNWILEQWLREHSTSEGDQRPPAEEHHIQRALGWMLDQESGPRALVDGHGRVIATNMAALDAAMPPQDVLASDATPRRAIPGTPLALIDLDGIIDAEFGT